MLFLLCLRRHFDTCRINGSRLCLCLAVADAQNHPDTHPDIQVIGPSFPQQRGGSQPRDRTHHHPGRPGKGRDHRGVFPGGPGVLKPPVQRCYRDLICAFLCYSHRTFQMGTAHPHPSPRGAAAAPAASTHRPPRGAA